MIINAPKLDKKLAPKWRMHDKCTKVDEKMIPKWRMHEKLHQSGWKNGTNIDNCNQSG